MKKKMKRMLEARDEEENYEGKNGKTVRNSNYIYRRKKLKKCFFVLR